MAVELTSDNAEIALRPAPIIADRLDASGISTVNSRRLRACASAHRDPGYHPVSRAKINLLAPKIVVDRFGGSTPTSVGGIHDQQAAATSWQHRRPVVQKVVRMVQEDWFIPFPAVEGREIFSPYGSYRRTPPDGMCRAEGEPNPARTIDGQTRQCVFRSAVVAAVSAPTREISLPVQGDAGIRV